MEQDRTTHAEGTRPSPFLIASPPIGHTEEPLAVKLQNGSPLVARPHPEVNGDNAKSQSFQSCYRIPHIKGSQRSHESPDFIHEGRGYSRCLHNGGIKRTLSEPSLSELHLKKLKLDQKAKGESNNFGERNVGKSSSQPNVSGLSDREPIITSIAQESTVADVDAFPTRNYNGVENTAFQIINEQQEGENGRNITLLKNKTVLMPNGATVSAPSVESTHGELEKAHCYPDCVSIAVQNTTSHVSSLSSQTATELSSEIPQPSLTSAQINFSQTSSSQLPPEPAAMVTKACDADNASKPAGVLGSYSFQKAEHQQKSVLEKGPSRTESKSIQRNMKAFAEEYYPSSSSGLHASHGRSKETNGAHFRQRVMFPNSATTLAPPSQSLLAPHLVLPSEGKAAMNDVALEEHHHHPSQSNLTLLREGKIEHQPTTSSSQSLNPSLHIPNPPLILPEQHQNNCMPPCSEKSRKMPEYLMPPNHGHSGGLQERSQYLRGHREQEVLKDANEKPTLYTVESSIQAGRGWIQLKTSYFRETLHQTKCKETSLHSFLHSQTSPANPTSSKQSTGNLNMPGGFQRLPYIQKTAQPEPRSQMYQVDVNQGPGMGSQHLQFQKTSYQECIPRTDLSPEAHLQAQSVPQYHHLQQRVNPSTDKHLSQKATETQLLSRFLQHTPHKAAHTQAPQNSNIPQFCQQQQQQQQQQQHQIQRKNKEQTPHAFTPLQGSNDKQREVSRFGQIKAEESKNQYSKSSNFQNKTPNLQNMQCFPDNVTPNQDVHHRCFGEQEQKLRASLQGLKDRSQAEVTALLAEAAQQRYLHNQSKALPVPEQTGSHTQTPQKDNQKHAALRWLLLQKQEQQQIQQSQSFGHNQMHRAVKTEPGSKPSSCVRKTLPMSEPQENMSKRIKQEIPSPSCGNNGQPKSIIETIEQHLKQFQPQALNEYKALTHKSQKQVKVETSTNIHAAESENHTPATELQAALSERIPMKRPYSVLNKDSESHQSDIPDALKDIKCQACKNAEKDEAPSYDHLGAGPNVAAIRTLMEERYGEKGKAVRIEKVVYTGKEGKSSQGCPVAKWIYRRSSEEEKVLCLVRERPNHTCDTAVMVIAIMLWDGISKVLASNLYSELKEILSKRGISTNRRCAQNENRNCCCQGENPETCGASFSFGCSWSMYYNGCKFSRSKTPRKFRLQGDDPKQEERLGSHLDNLATILAPIYKQLAPDAYANQVKYEHQAQDCRLGLGEGRPFSGVTACLDFSAHAHRDLQNLPNGSTVVVTLNREDNREFGAQPEDEQLHVLPLYTIAAEDEFGSTEGQKKKILDGSIQVLHSFRRKRGKRVGEPAKSCRQKKPEGKKATRKLSCLENYSNKNEKEKSSRTKQLESASHMPQMTAQPRLPGSVIQQPLSLQGHLPQGQRPQPPQPQHVSHSSGSTNAYMSQPYPSSTHTDIYGDANHVNFYPTSSHTMGPYLSPPNSLNSYPGHFNQNNQYAAFQCNGSVSADNGSPALGSYSLQAQSSGLHRYASQNHLTSLSLPPIHTLYPQSFGDSPSKFLSYGNQNMQRDAFTNCTVKPNIHNLATISPYPTPTMDGHFMGAASGSPYSHPNTDYKTSEQHLPSHTVYGYTAAASDSVSSSSQAFHNKENDNTVAVQGPSYNLTDYSQEQQPGVSGQDVASEEDSEYWSDSEHNFRDPTIGGVAIAPTHGSILIECARCEIHATTKLNDPNKNDPSRISLVFYQHKTLILPKHGFLHWEAKKMARTEKEEHSKQEKPEPQEQEPTYLRFIQSLAENTGSMTTDSTVTTAPYASTQVTGHYNTFV
ncbi:methylcytosine dioxygenase TET2 [Apodemus sylvaticus]|uniref:methylcytosine dioxygenase TET2 n=1 Tax=Apodemus sylvaticus TaxID=10129 RepID=UPI0022439D69|nr:methylcytosine dioxygenase TET2 [Apodemus sylvaticus]XP_052035168.1 methylcytosine dioxygenase TET2 [Apodemus sylvaticus]XP_052035169.1 methylcytosine dioxygenase TET2 [Apodemus sylvaticus]